MAKVMLVEDDNNLREIYVARLAAEGYETVSAHDGEEALALAVKEKPDLIISDIMMPKISGFDMLDILRTTPETKNTKVIMMTALSQAEDRERAGKLGADRYLVKSQVTLEDVIKVAHEVLSDTSHAGAADAANAADDKSMPNAPTTTAADAAPSSPPEPKTTDLPVAAAPPAEPPKEDPAPPPSGTPPVLDTQPPVALTEPPAAPITPSVPAPPTTPSPAAEPVVPAPTPAAVEPAATPTPITVTDASEAAATVAPTAPAPTTEPATNTAPPPVTTASPVEDQIKDFLANNPAVGSSSPDPSRPTVQIAPVTDPAAPGAATNSTPKMPEQAAADASGSGAMNGMTIPASSAATATSGAPAPEAPADPVADPTATAAPDPNTGSVIAEPPSHKKLVLEPTGNTDQPAVDLQALLAKEEAKEKASAGAPAGDQEASADKPANPNDIAL